MHDFFMAIKSWGTAIGGATGLTMFASTSINFEEGRVSIAVAVTCTVFICGICWWLASRFQSIADSQAEMNKRLTKIENELTARNEADDRQD